jgi:predicted small integral membrane protein
VLVIRLSKVAVVAAFAVYVTLVAFGNITDYATNFEFVRHVLMMDTIFSNSSIAYRAISNPILHHAAYLVIIATQLVCACLCWRGAARLFAQRKAVARAFNQTKSFAVAGLCVGFLLWQVGFTAIGGEWFGMWMSETWNGLGTAFRVSLTILAILVFLVIPDGELDD